LRTPISGFVAVMSRFSASKPNPVVLASGSVSETRLLLLS
jgi:hypothetical protein